MVTNAGKHGPLSTRDGRAEIAWSLKPGEDRKEAFVMSWREQGRPPVTAPETKGFGSTVISQIAVESLGAHVELDFAADGLSWRLECPASKVLSNPPVS